MELSSELINKARKCKSAEEIKALAKQNGIEMTEKEAAEAFARLNKTGELADDELNSAAGGGCFSDSGEEPKFSVGQSVTLMYSTDGNGNKCKGVVTEVCGKKPTGEFFYKVRYNCVLGEVEDYVLEGRLELS